MVNKKAVGTYIVLLIIVASVCFYIYYAQTQRALYNKPTVETTITGGKGGAVISAANGVSGGASGIISKFYNKSYANSVPSNKSLECSAGTSYTCTAPTFYSEQGVFSFNFSQQTGSTWQSARFFYVNYTDIPKLAQYTGYSYNGTEVSNIAPGAVTHIVLYTGRQSLGDQPYGEIWSIYQLAGNGTAYSAEIGRVNST